MILYNRMYERIYLNLTNTNCKKENFLLYKDPRVQTNLCGNETCFETCQWRRLP